MRRIIVDCFFTSHFFFFFHCYYNFYALAGLNLDEEQKNQGFKHKLAPLSTDEYNLLIECLLLDPQCRLPWKEERMIILSTVLENTRVLENTEVYFESYC
jgi:hypothetical protein